MARACPTLHPRHAQTCLPRACPKDPRYPLLFVSNVYLHGRVRYTFQRSSKETPRRKHCAFRSWIPGTRPGMTPLGEAVGQCVSPSASMQTHASGQKESRRRAKCPSRVMLGLVPGIHERHARFLPLSALHRKGRRTAGGFPFTQAFAVR